MKKNPARVSVHGGHSGQFCSHATDSLEEIIEAYIATGFSWVGITEHMPALADEFLYPEEKKAGFTVEFLNHRFGQYVREGRRLQHKYRHQVILFVGMEIETCKGYREMVGRFLEEFEPDYIVGSVHHVDDMPIDYSPDMYAEAAHSAGGMDNLYCRYFDQQFEMLKYFKPAVVGHFDLIRIYDPQYRNRLKKPPVMERIERNLDFIQQEGLILDYNLRALLKGADEPYVSREILSLARQREIAVVPGDDSHGADSIGLYIDRAMLELEKLGFNTNWRTPALYKKGNI
ncbi:histidinol-phosphatase [Desulfopila inferna]|uniref:histidinol-phosphatase n=1 Tax=Desulfopila inferna TaxID=468528 RepID=UPI001962EC8C|nr:histidinol-phosphatase [Desulfopila inferna]MBM9603558.1 histidinol-phosphatase [Desulfopila inferna]